MNKESIIPFVTNQSNPIDGGFRRAQRIGCTTPNCEHHKDVTFTGKPKPETVLYGIARKAGWNITKKVAHCPSCVDALNTRKPKKGPPMIAETRRAIFREIDKHYDEVAQCYRGLVADEHIAKALGFHVDEVAVVREANFGPAENANVTKAVEAIDLLSEQADQLELDILQASEKADQIRKDIEFLKASLPDVFGEPS